MSFYDSSIKTAWKKGKLHPPFAHLRQSRASPVSVSVTVNLKLKFRRVQLFYLRGRAARRRRPSATVTRGRFALPTELTGAAAQSWEPIISRRRAGRGPEGTGHGSICDDSEWQHRYAPGPNSGCQVTGSVRRRRWPRPVVFLNSKPFLKLPVCRWGSNSGYEHVALNFKLAG